jgi:serine/threonine-protein kinase
LLYHTFVGTAVTVPNVVGSSQAVATQTLTNAGFKVKVQSDFSDQFAVGFVDRQSPPANTKLVKGESVTIWVVKGALHLQLPSFIGQTPKYVETFLSQNGLVGKRLSGTSNTVPAGTVFKQNPPGGTTVARGDTVTYWVSKGPAQVLVPDVTGTDKATAASMLKAAGLALGSVTTQPSDTVQKGYVISQSPAPNTQVDKGSAVDLVLSSGPSPSPSPTTSPTGAQVTVPPVIGMDVTTATTTLSDAGLLVSVKQKPHTGQPSGTVVDQNPAADTVVPEGTVVTLTVAK